MNSPHFLSTDGKLFRLTLQGTLRPALPEDVARFERERAAGTVAIDVTGAVAGGKAAVRDALADAPGALSL